ncbi:hypothetical protein BV25DRAFT_794181 [Artomyces pyxidatus]|uniref:Uncharacterized protein n=1 Tax=Artomyces pyxidatus TaxID=48021 RepID=A0ACB8SZH1_9AGAM|nr:hypothetical protein BV25DRAFT_794181 [Artomyces pyxidatus]
MTWFICLVSPHSSCPRLALARSVPSVNSQRRMCPLLQGLQSMRHAVYGESFGGPPRRTPHAFRLVPTAARNITLTTNILFSWWTKRSSESADAC